MGASHSGYKLLVSGEATPQVDWIVGSKSKLTILKDESVEMTKAIGKGKFGHVFMCKHIPTSKYLAIKYIPKTIIHECQSASRIQQEMEVLLLLKHPFIVTYYCAYETNQCFCICLHYASGGELYSLMKKSHKFSEQMAKFYFCEIALALSYLHNDLNIVYRDLKPENILLDCHGHVKLCDFGFAAPLDSEKSTLIDGCGTAMYVAPEIAGGFMKKNHSFPVDWWGLGCVLFEMIAGKAPFGDTDKMSKFEIFNNINAKNPSVPFFTNKQLKSLINGLLVKDPNSRMNWKHVQSHPWLTDVSWDDFMNLKIIPPWKPLNNKAPNTDCFLSWNELKLPTEAVSHEVGSYCNSISIPKVKAELSKGRNGENAADDEMDLLDKSSKNKPSPALSQSSRRKSISGSGMGSPSQVIPDNTKNNMGRRASMSRQISLKGEM